MLPSAQAGSEDEYSDFLVPNPDAPQGYSFTTSGCAVDQTDGTVAFAPAPVDVEISQPVITFVAAHLAAQFVVDAEGVLRSSGSFDADDVHLGASSSGPAHGALVGRRIPENEVPADIPKP